MAKKTCKEDALSLIIRRKHYLAEEYFKNKYVSKKEREQRNVILLEILEQITVCEEMMRPVSEAIIKAWVDNDSIGYIMRTSRSIKFA